MKQPNIVLIYIDDMGWRDLGCYGSQFYETPHIDALAAQGMRFSQAYATCPVCSPSRASVLTGKYPAAVGITGYIQWYLKEGQRDVGGRGRLMDVPFLKNLPHDEATIASALRDGGYATWHVGKWHLGGQRERSLPTDHGFDVNIGGSHHGMPVRSYFSPYGMPFLDDGPEDEFLTDRLTDEAIGLMQAHHASGQNSPFFLNLWHYAVHTPIMAKPEDVQHFREKAQRLKLDAVDPIVIGEPFPSEAKKHERLTRRILQSHAEYAALIYNLDWNVGRLLKAIDALGQTEDTLIIFSSDNGGLSTSEGAPTCNLPLAEGKGWLYEGGVREPLIIKWPGRVRANSLCDAVVTGADLYPTFLEAAGLPLMPQQHRDGISMLGAIMETGSIAHEAIFWHYPHYGNQGGTPGCAVRAGEYKLIEYFEDGHLELYNLTEDISESHNLADALPIIRDRLYGLLSDWKRAVEAQIPEPNPGYVPGV